MASRETVINIPVEEIVAAEGRRPLNEEAVRRIAQSIREIGLQHPITVRSVSGEFKLIAGAHRLAAYIRLGEDTIPASVVKMDNEEAEMWEISENLHRADLTKLERDVQIARWIEIKEARRVSRQVDEKIQGRPESGVAAASRELGLSEPDARRAKDVASLTEDAKQAARDTGLDDNRSALLEASKMPPDQQAQRISELAAAKAAKPPKIAPDPLNDMEAQEVQVASLMSAWNKACAAARQEFLLRIDQPVMDASFGAAA